MTRGTTAILSIILFLNCGLVFAQTHEDWRLERDYKSALRMMDSGHYDTAIQFFDMVLKKDPNRSDAYYQRGIAKWRTNDEQGALADFDQAIDISPHHYKAVWDRADLKKSREDVHGAIEDYTLYIDLAKTSDHSSLLYDAYNKRGDIKLKIDDRQGAIKDFQTAIRLAPDNHVAYYRLGRLAYEEQNFKEAVKQFDKTLEYDKGSFMARYFRGMARYRLNDYYGALEDLDSCQYNVHGQDRAVLLYTKGMAKIHKNFKSGGCKDLKEALNMGYQEAEAAIEQYCR